VIKRSTWIILAIFILILGFVVYWRRSGRGEEVIATPTPESRLLNINSDDMREITIQGSDQKMVGFTRNEQGQWVFLDPEATIDESVDVVSSLSQLVQLRVLNTFNTAPKAEITALADPMYVVTISLADGTKRRLLVGAATPTGTGYYVQADDGPVNVVSKSELDPIIYLYLEPPYAEQTSTPSSGITPSVSP